ncbi:MAG: hypothetical protein EP304_04485 [Deltaproteobacteria bacterium]|nr:MAG: hypothetical protein EP304_04485 [Deltaproteobacteria bacterium]
METKQSLKKFFFLLGTWFVVIVAVIGGSFLYDRYKTSEFDDRAVPYIKEVIPEISQWNPTKTKALMASEVAADISEEKFAQAMDLFSRLGQLQSVEEPKFIDVHSGKQGDIGEQTIIEYEIDVQYANGEATINLKLLLRDGLFEIYNFNFSSEALLK